MILEMVIRMRRVVVIALIVGIALVGGGYLVFRSLLGSTPVPAKVLNLTDWKLSLPVESARTREPEEVKQPALRQYASWYFSVNAARTGVVFRARVGGAPIVSGGFARTELREMTDGGRQKATWSGVGLVNTMTIRESIDHLPPVHPSIVAGQIHGAGDHYVALVRLDDHHLYVKTEAGTAGTLDDNYRLGTIFTIQLVSGGGTIRVYYNGSLKVVIQDDCSGCYFKAGAYLQSNAKWDGPDAYGQVTIYDLTVTH